MNNNNTNDFSNFQNQNLIFDNMFMNQNLNDDLFSGYYGINNQNLNPNNFNNFYEINNNNLMKYQRLEIVKLLCQL